MHCLLGLCVLGVRVPGSGFRELNAKMLGDHWLGNLRAAAAEQTSHHQPTVPRRAMEWLARRVPWPRAPLD